MHALSQQTPSTQKPEVHWPLPLHDVPLPSFGLQTPPEQNVVVVQSVSVAQSPRQAFAPHENGAQSCVFFAGQLPVPEHRASRTATPAVHDPARQTLSVPGYLQLVRTVPSQTPPQSEPSPAQSGRVPTGAPLTAEHVPAFDGRLHASHWPEQAVSQQTPSMQLPDAHWVPATHAAPLPSFAMHSPPPQNVPDAQSVSAPQVVAQIVPAHLYGAQVVVASAGHLPLPSQAAAAVATPAEQEAARQLVVPDG